MPCNINNNTSYDLSELEGLVSEFMPFAQKRIGFKKPPTINFMSDEENATNPLGKTGQYDPNSMEISIFVDGRHIKDILRSISHELVHHGQNCRGEFDRQFSTDVGYAQNDEFLRGMEEEAYKEGNFCLRDWEDGIKMKNKQLHETIYKETLIGGEKNMSIKQWKDKELNDLLMEKWGYKKPVKKEEKKQLNEEVDSFMDMKVGWSSTQDQVAKDDEEGDETSFEEMQIPATAVEMRQDVDELDEEVDEARIYEAVKKALEGFFLKKN
tara:strand:- start:323 stop:1126 length:804 start_codon:yes stop_codon:yes gene_type:complete